MKRLIAFAISAALLAFIPAMTSCSEKITGETGIDEEGKPSDSENDGTGESFGITVTELHCKSGDIDIYGQLYTPDGKEGRLPVIVLSHSSSLTHAAMAPYAKYLSGKGYAAYCFDFCGACDGSKSTGRSTDEMTVFTEVEDLEIVLG